MGVIQALKPERPAGFKAVARLAFDPEYQPPGDGKVVTDYDAGIQAQKDALK